MGSVAGLVISPKWPFLGCSPDGIVLENGVPLAALRLNGHIPNRI